jgi:hypothetical protein
MRKLILICCLFPILFYSQEDFGTWAKISFDYKLNKKISFNSKSELRTEDNSRTRKQLYTQFSSKYKFNKKLSINLAYRLKSLNKEYGEEIQNRFHSDVNYRIKIEDFSILLRSRTQYNITYNSENEWYERTRLKVKYEFNKKLSCFLYNEFYFLLNNSNNSSFNKNRLSSGVEYKISKSLAVQLKYLRIKDVNVDNPKTMNIVGASFAHRLN